MAKQPDVLRVFPLEPGCPRYVVQNLTRNTLHFPNVERRTCTCRHAEVYPTNPRCYHLEEATATEEARLELLRKMPIQAARAHEEATGERRLPQIKDIPQEELRATFA